ncbi:hypothetical protein [Pseudorhodobacter aquimaris]|uniref:hypothetical protein n=1 Tax=Pseudorhodobacter aquimaris TaxID=687412 RepID=UPI00067BC595|nr:hypothetical protein [Pseudorhodobacter aquimaris]
MKKLSDDRTKRAFFLRNSQFWSMHGHVEGAFEDDSPQGDLDAIENEKNSALARIEERYSRLTFIFSALGLFAVDFGLPLVVGLIATFNPAFVTGLADSISSL